MINQQDELQAKEFLKRVEIITMKKDLRKLREVDALKERNKIVSGGFQKPTLKTTNAEGLNEVKEKFEREKILNENYMQEVEAEKQLNDYATEEEKQRIFILDSEKIQINKKIKENRAKKESELVMKKNEIEIEKNKLVGKLKEIQKAEEKLESDQKVISDKEKTTNISSEKEGLEKRRWELEENTKEIEKNRWAIEREIEGKNKGIETVDQDYKKMIEEENDLKQKNTDVDKQLRQIYSQIISKVQNTKKQEAEDKITAQGKTAKAEAIEKENIQRKQWTKSPSARAPEKEYLQNISTTAKENLNKQAEDEETHRQKFLQDIETKTNEENKK